MVHVSRIGKYAKLAPMQSRHTFQIVIGMKRLNGYETMSTEQGARLSRMRDTEQQQEGVRMNYYKLKYEDGRSEIVKARTDLDVVKRYDLATREHVNTRIIRLEGEQLAIARSNDMCDCGSVITGAGWCQSVRTHGAHL